MVYSDRELEGTFIRKPKTSSLTRYPEPNCRNGDKQGNGLNNGPARSTRQHALDALQTRFHGIETALIPE